MPVKSRNSSRLFINRQTQVGNRSALGFTYRPSVINVYLVIMTHRWIHKRTIRVWGMLIAEGSMVHTHYFTAVIKQGAAVRAVRAGVKSSRHLLIHL